MNKRLDEVAAVIRSKNAGPFAVTFDIIFDDQEVFEHLKGTAQITRARFAATYGFRADEVTWYVYDPGLGFKATVRRDRASGDPLDDDVYGCQRHAPLLDWLVDLPPAEEPSK